MVRLKPPFRDIFGEICIYELATNFGAPVLEIDRERTGNSEFSMQCCMSSVFDMIGHYSFIFCGY